ncbi:hypothetical protein DKM19_02425 [Streptosporangium sp. 'caverna']|nr:hypothetical protein DKM19_02425 [Streptosporangium sp. 'caverna']
MGHSTTQTALIYPHVENGRNQMIPDGMGKLAEAALKKEDPPGSGTSRARKTNQPGKQSRPGAGIHP